VNVQAATLVGDGSPPVTTNHFSDVPRPLPRRTKRVAHVDCFPARAAFPKWQEGWHPPCHFRARIAFPTWQEGWHPPCHFRGLPRLHSRYGRRIVSSARLPLSQGSDPTGYPIEPPASFQTDRHIRVRSSLTDDSRPRGALPSSDIGQPHKCGVKLGVRGRD
jgi:hypothetical protein